MKTSKKNIPTEEITEEPNMEQKQRWYIPHDESSALDALEDVRSILAFFSDTVTQDVKPEALFQLSPDGTTGFYFLIAFCQDVLGDSLKKLREKAEENDLLRRGILPHALPLKHSGENRKKNA